MSLGIREEASLQDGNTLRLPCIARWSARARSDADIDEAIAFSRSRAVPLLVLGGGSNVVLPERFPGLLLQMQSRGIDVLEETAEGTLLRVAAGEPWHEFVLHCHARGWHGLENLALIPGTVGAAPIQNIGAYGVELAPFLREIEAVELDSGRPRIFPAADCGFGYRDSIFRGGKRARVLIRRVLFFLPRGRPPEIRYAALAEALRGEGSPTPEAVLRAVIAIRRRRLPDPAVLPNAGSFFKNPVIEARSFRQLQAAHPGLVHWRQSDGRVKLAAAWLVEACGFKGYREEGAGVHEAQALVLVNHGGATAASLLALAGRIREAVLARFGVALEIEPVLC